MISPAYIQYRARQASLWVALPLALISLVLFAVSYYFYYFVRPAHETGDYTSVLYLKAARDNKATQIKESHSDASTAVAAEVIWEGLKQKHGAIKGFDLHSSSITNYLPFIRLQQCDYKIKFADGEHVFVRMELRPRHFTSTHWAVNTVTLLPRDTAQR